MTDDIGEIARAIATVSSKLDELHKREDLILQDPPQLMKEITIILHDKECRRSHSGSSYPTCRFKSLSAWTADDRKAWLIKVSKRIGTSGKTLEEYAVAVRTVYPKED